MVIFQQAAKVKPIFSELDQIAEFKEFMKTLDLYEPAEAIIIEQEVSILLSEKEMLKAKKAFEELCKKFPDSKARIRTENLFSREK